MAIPQPTRRDYHILGQRHGASIPRCVAAHARLTAQFDPRHRPPDEQPTWIAVQNALDASLALIYDAGRWDAQEVEAAA